MSHFIAPRRLGSIGCAYLRTQHFVTLDELGLVGTVTRDVWVWDDGTVHIWQDGSDAIWTTPAVSPADMDWEDGDDMHWEDGTPIDWEPNNPGTPPPPPPYSDEIPNPFQFEDLTGVALSTSFTSNLIYVTGIDGTWNFGFGAEPLGVPMTVTNGEYSVNGREWDDQPTEVYLNDNVQVRGTSSGSFSTTASVILDINGVADAFDITTAPEAPDTTPAAFVFTDITDAPLSTVHTSNTITISEINAATPISIVGGTYSRNSGPFVSTPGTVVNGDQIQVRVTSAASHSAVVSCVLTAGGVSDAYSVTTLAAPVPDTTPTAFVFTDLADVPIDTFLTSNQITVLDINAPAAMTITGGQYSINGAAYASDPVDVNLNDQIRVCQTSSGSYETATDVVLTIGGVSDTWRVTTQVAPPADTTPDQFSFVDEIDADISTVYTSNEITIAGIDTPSPLTITGGTYSKNAGAYVSTPTTVDATDTITVRQTSSSLFATTTNVVLTIGGVSDTYSVMTAAAPPDTTPNQFAFTDVLSIPLSTVVSSNAITVQGITAASDVTVSGGTWNKNGGAFTSAAGTVVNGDQVRVRHTSSGTNSTQTNTALTIGGVSDVFTSTTVSAVPPPDTTPTQFTFTDVTGATISTLYTSNTITVLAIDSAAPMTITAGEYSKNAGAWATAPTTVVVNDTVAVRQTSSASYSTQTNTVLTIGTVSDTYSVTTAAPPVDTTPDPFIFNDVTNMPLSTLQVSNTITVLGINAASAMTITGGEYSINLGAWASGATTVVLNDQVRVRQTSSGSHSTQTVTTLSIGGVSETFTLTTVASGSQPTYSSLSSPSWLMEVNDYPYIQCGWDYINATYQTRFAFEAGVSGTVTTCSTTAEMVAAITAAKSDGTKKGINLNPGNYTWSNNLLAGLNRVPSDCFVIRTTPGAGTQAVMTRINELNGQCRGIAFVDLNIRAGLVMQGPASSTSQNVYRDILVERCTGWVVIQGQSLNNTPYRPAENIVLRLNHMVDHWGAPANNLTHALYTYNIDGLLLEGNIIDHNGWDPAFDRTRSSSLGGPTVRKHNLYINAPCEEFVCRFNWISRASSHGLHMKHSGRCYRNIFSRNPIGVQACYGGDGNFAEFPVPNDVEVKNNLFCGAADITQSLSRGMAIYVNWVNGAVYDGNYMLFDHTSLSNSAEFLIERLFPITCTISNNVSYQWKGGGLDLRPPGVPPYPAIITQANNTWGAASISAPAQALAYQLGCDPVDANDDAWLTAYRAARFRLGVDIVELQTWMEDIISGVTP